MLLNDAEVTLNLSNVANWGFKILQAILIPLIYKILSKVKATDDKIADLDKTLGGLKIILVGLDGNNGLNSRVKILEDIERRKHEQH